LDLSIPTSLSVLNLFPESTLRALQESNYE
jgi:hypothetical protein